MDPEDCIAPESGAGHPADTRDIERRLTMLLGKLSERRDRTNQELDRARTVRARAVDRLVTTESLYRASSDGLAESLRQIEHAILAQQPRGVVRRMQRLHIAAEESSEVEYKQRTARWGHRAGDGPLRACPVGADPALGQLIVQDRLFATYRVDPQQSTTQIRVLRITNTGRRLYLHASAPNSEPTVVDVLRHHTRTETLLARFANRLDLNPEEYRAALSCSAHPNPQSG